MEKSQAVDKEWHLWKQAPKGGGKKGESPNPTQNKKGKGRKRCELRITNAIKAKNKEKKSGGLPKKSNSMRIGKETTLACHQHPQDVRKVIEIK